VEVQIFGNVTSAKTYRRVGGGGREGKQGLCEVWAPIWVRLSDVRGCITWRMSEKVGRTVTNSPGGQGSPRACLWACRALVDGLVQGRRFVGVGGGVRSADLVRRVASGLTGKAIELSMRLVRWGCCCP
jgi:hypothetical protein